MIGMVSGMYLGCFTSLTGAVLVCRDEPSPWFRVEWLVKLHSNLLAGPIGRSVNSLAGSESVEFRKRGAMALIKRHAARHTANERGARPHLTCHCLPFLTYRPAEERGRCDER
jgi:hypothetical protein